MTALKSELNFSKTSSIVEKFFNNQVIIKLFSKKSSTDI